MQKRASGTACVPRATRALRLPSPCEVLTCMPALARLDHPSTQDLKIMNAPARTALMEVTTQDLEYQRIGGKPQLARLYRPQGEGPFPAVVLALDLRLAPQAPYPASVADVNFGIRWLKAHSVKLGSRPDWVGAVATSSGGQQALLSAMRPRDARYASAQTSEVPMSMRRFPI